MLNFNHTIFLRMDLCYLFFCFVFYNVFEEKWFYFIGRLQLIMFCWGK